MPPRVHRLGAATNSWASRGIVARAPVPQYVRVVRHIPPAEDGQSLLGGQFGDTRACARAHCAASVGQEDQPGRVAARGGQAEAAGGAEQGVRHLRQDAGPVTGVRVAALGAAVVQVPQHGERLGHGVMGPAPGQVGDKPDAARVVLVLAVVQSA